MKLFYFDVETTGLDSFKNDIVQLSAIIEIDGNVEETFNINIQPVNWDNISPESLKVIGKTIEDLKEYTPPYMAYKELLAILGKYVDKFDRNDKFVVSGYNVNFDIQFLRDFFRKCNDTYYGSWFSSQYIDSMQLMYFMHYCGFCKLENYQLGTVCEHFGIEIKAHDALSDIQATRDVFKRICSLIEIKGVNETL